MPAAVVLFLEALRDGTIYGATGQHAHGFWLQSGRDVIPAGDDLHDERPMRQFTVSPLLGLGDVRRGVTLVTEGQQARLRLTLLDDDNRHDLLQGWLSCLPDTAQIGGVHWRLAKVVDDRAEHPGAGRDEYAELRDRYGGQSDAPVRWTLSFESPMAFNLQIGQVLPFPLPDRLVAGWLGRWNEYAPMPLTADDDTPAAFLGRVEGGLRVSNYKLKTVSFRFRHAGPDGRRTQEVPQIGCVGEITLDGRELSVVDRATIASLVDYSFYCGSGHHTAMGMGQTRPLVD